MKSEGIFKKFPEVSNIIAAITVKVKTLMTPMYRTRYKNHHHSFEIATFFFFNRTVKKNIKICKSRSLLFISHSKKIFFAVNFPIKKKRPRMFEFFFQISINN